ncbi:MAG: FHA domain-containing protein [Methanoregula sp.]|nr:FHA domain-containing protein [Methanoregula sp.]
MKAKDRAPTIVVDDSADSLDELSEYLDVLSSSARLRILKFLEKKPADVRTISGAIDTSYENTKKHLDKLLSIGVIKKEAGLSNSTSRGVLPVWEYSVVQGGLEAIIRNLSIFSNKEFRVVNPEISRKLASVKKTLSHDVLGDFPTAIVMGGTDDGRIFLFRKDMINIGRIEQKTETGAGTVGDIMLSDSYTAVTRIAKPHGRFVHDGDTWYIEDSGSTGGTRLNNHRLEVNARTPVHDGDVIELAKGIHGAKLLLLIPKSP